MRRTEFCTACNVNTILSKSELFLRFPQFPSPLYGSLFKLIMFIEFQGQNLSIWAEHNCSSHIKYTPPGTVLESKKNKAKKKRSLGIIRTTVYIYSIAYDTYHVIVLFTLLLTL